MISLGVCFPVPFSFGCRTRLVDVRKVYIRCWLLLAGNLYGQMPLDRVKWLPNHATWLLTLTDELVVKNDADMGHRQPLPADGPIG